MPHVLGSAIGTSFQTWLRRHVRNRGEVPKFPETESEIAAHKQAVRSIIEKAAGPTPEYDPLIPEIHQVHQRDGYRIEAVSFPTFGGLRMTATAYVPEADEPVPGILAVHGHSAHGRRDAKTSNAASPWRNQATSSWQWMPSGTANEASNCPDTTMAVTKPPLCC